MWNFFGVLIKLKIFKIFRVFEYSIKKGYGILKFILPAKFVDDFAIIISGDVKE